MKRCVLWIISALILVPNFVRAERHSEKLNYFGVPFAFSSEDKSTVELFLRHLQEKSAAYHGSLDPDCFYRNDQNKGCNKNVDKAFLTQAEKWASEFKSETGGAFNIVAKKGGKTYRDFGGMAQGLILHELAQMKTKGWTGNFAGDLFVAEGGHAPGPILVSDPLLMSAPFATVQMQAGWMMASFSPIFGAVSRDPASMKDRKTSEFAEVVLFARPSFNGARLDAWSTAIMAGGQKTLDRLWKNKEFAGQWGYLIFDKRYAAKCSDNIKCDLADSRTRKVQLDW